jgi:hypothetical protein
VRSAAATYSAASSTSTTGLPEGQQPVPGSAFNPLEVDDDPRVRRRVRQPPSRPTRKRSAKRSCHWPSRRIWVAPKRQQSTASSTWTLQAVTPIHEAPAACHSTVLQSNVPSRERHEEYRAEPAPRSRNARPPQHPEEHFGRGPVEISLISAVRTHALCVHTQECFGRRHRRAGGLEAAAHEPHLVAHTLHTSALRAVDKAPRKTPEKLASSTSGRTRNRWSGACAPARGARLTSGRGGGGSVG